MVVLDIHIYYQQYYLDLIDSDTEEAVLTEEEATEEEATEEEAARRIKPTVNQKGDGGGGF